MRSLDGPRRAAIIAASFVVAIGASFTLVSPASGSPNTTGSYWLCANSFGSSGCLFALRTQFGSLANDTNYFVDGASLAANTTHQFRYAMTTDSDEACHSGTIWTTATTNSFGNITTSPKVYTGTSPGAGDGAAGPGVGSWQICTTNDTGDNYGPHNTITIT